MLLTRLQTRADAGWRATELERGLDGLLAGLTTTLLAVDAGDDGTRESGGEPSP